MGNTNPWKTQQSHHQSFTRKFLPYVLYAILPLVLIHFYLYPSPPILSSPTKNHFSYKTISISSPPSSSSEQKSENGVSDSVSVSLKEKETANESFYLESKDSEDENANFHQESKGNGNENENFQQQESKENIESKENGNENENFQQKESKENIVNENLPQETTLPPEEKEIVNEIINSSSLTPKGDESKNENLPEEKGNNENSSTCDYTNGEWVQDNRGPLYNGSSCGTIKDGQNCMNHGRPDTDYLYWRWKPSHCDLPRFEPRLLLQILEGKHLAFVGDSMARNQLESLLCMLSSVSSPNLIYSSGEDNKFRRWHFPSHNVNVSVYWSPFLVKGIEKSSEQNYNRLFFESIDERWGSDLGSIDMVVLSIGHWYLHPAIYRDGDVELGCHAVESVNCTETEFYDVYGKAFNTSLKAIIERKLGKEGNGIDVIITTFSPHHFEGDWDKFGACPKTKPYLEVEKSLDAMDSQMRDKQVDEVEKAKKLLNASPKVRVAALDITKLALLRPDGHPGPYMYANPFADGIKERVHNDCVHWCLPGPIDTWNEIMLDVVKRWYKPSMK